MAYISKEEKNEKATRLRALGKEYGLKLSVARKHYSTIVLNVQSGKIDFRGALKQEDNHYNPDFITVNRHYLDKQFNDGIAKEFLTKAIRIMDEGNYNNSDIMTDYFDYGFYVDINIGKCDKGYVLAV